ncbi:hypothetical protein [Formosa haliotis]|uniref:hypothetical protein n=1 Tax=Formosa haliotis TaxID=1555194 RepID=UPI00082567D1|nr:hypothetical protein [Formosa haliotis]
MLHVHPDKFSLAANEQESATDITTQLIEIYKNGTLQELQAFHTHIFTDQTQIKTSKNSKANIAITTEPLAHLKQVIKSLELEIKTLQASQLYHILTTYKKPLTFVDELIIYYKDKIEKLKKRTRTK